MTSKAIIEDIVKGLLKESKHPLRAKVILLSS